MIDIKNEYIPLVKKQQKELIETYKRSYYLGKLVIIQVGNNSASDRYVRNKLKDAKEIGICAELISFAEDITEEKLESCISELNKDDSVTGYIVQLPLPKHIDEKKIISMIDPSKDADGFRAESITNPATAVGIYDFVFKYLQCGKGMPIVGKNAVIIGRSDIVGRPMAKLLSDKTMNMNVTLLHSHTSEKDKKFYIEHADLIVVATGHRHTLTKEYRYKPTAVIMDVGINFDEDGKMCGDCDDDLQVAYKSPVPGGCGLLTRIALIDNFIVLFEKKHKLI